jgi:hypothetical protein
MLRLITQALWYVTNQTLHTDLGIAPVREIFKDKAEAHRNTLSAHPNPLMEPLTIPSPTRRLRRKWTFDNLKQDGVAGLLLDTEIKPSALA